MLKFGIHLLIVLEILFQAQKGYNFSLLLVLKGVIKKIKIFFVVFIGAIFVTIPYYILFFFPGLIRSIELLLFGPLVIFQEETTLNIKETLKKSEHLMYGFEWAAFFGLLLISIPPLMISSFLLESLLDDIQGQIIQIGVTMISVGIIWFNLSACFIVKLYLYTVSEKNELKA